ncbi:MAG: hypothetical protein SNI51_09010 [Rikenellaceae bacterium]
MMRKSTLLAVICMTFISLSGFAQMGGMGGGQRGGQRGGGQGQPMPQQQRKIEVNFTGSAGYFFIDVEEALDKIKLKKNPSKVDAVVEVITRFNSTHQHVVEANRIDVDNLEFAQDNLEAVQGDMTAMREIMMQVGESSRKIKPIMVEAHKRLVDEITPLLSEKELKGWSKYYDNLCDDNNFDPNAPERSGGPRGEGDEQGHGPRGEMPTRE